MKALFICPLDGSSGPSADTPPLHPCAEIVPGPLEMIRPSNIENSNLSLSVGFLPIRARNDASVKVQSLISSAFLTPQKLSAVCFATGTLHPTNPEKILEYPRT